MTADSRAPLQSDRRRIHPEKCWDKNAHGASIFEVAFSCHLLTFTHPSSPPPHHAVAVKREGGSYRNRAAQSLAKFNLAFKIHHLKFKKQNHSLPLFDRSTSPFNRSFNCLFTRMKRFHIFLAVMKTIPRFLLVTSLAASSSLLSPDSVHAAVRPTEESAPKLPEIWQKAGPRERLKATRAAELDADRLLAERLYGVQVDADTTVADLAMSDDRIASAVQASLVGSLTVGQPEYFADGRVEVVKAVKIEQVIETLRRKTKEKLFADGRAEIVSSDETTELSTKGKVLEVMGNAALPGSEGH